MSTDIAEFDSVLKKLYHPDPAEMQINIRWFIEDLEDVMLAAPQTETKLEHVIEHGMYARTIHFPAGVLVTGKIHRRGSINVMSSGHISILTETGCATLKGHNVIPSGIGTKRLARVHEPTIWTTLYRTDGRTLAEVEADVFMKTYVDELTLEQLACLV